MAEIEAEGLNNINESVEGLGDGISTNIGSLNETIKDGLTEIKAEILKVAVQTLPKEFLDLAKKVEELCTYTKTMSTLAQESAKDQEAADAKESSDNKPGPATGWTPDKLASKLSEREAAPALTIVESLNSFFGEKGTLTNLLSGLLSVMMLGGPKGAKKEEKKGGSGGGELEGVKGPDDKAIDQYSQSVKKIDKLFGGILKVFFKNKKPRFDDEQVKIIEKSGKMFENLGIVFAALKGATKDALVAGLLAAPASLFMPFIERFVNSAKSLLDLFDIKKETLDQAAKQTKQVNSIFVNLIKAEKNAIIAGLLALPAALMVIIITLFLLSTVLLGLVAKLVPYMTLQLTGIALVIVFVTILIGEIAAIFAGLLAIPAFIGVILIMLFMGATALLGLIAGYALVPIAILALTGILMGLAFIFVLLGVICALAVTKIIEGNQEALLNMPITLAQFFLLVAVMGLASIPVMIAVIPLMITSVLLFAAFLLLTLTVLMAIAVTKLLKTTPDLVDMPKELAKFFLFIVPLGLLSILVAVVAIPLMIAAALLMATFVMLTVTILAAIAVSKLSKNLDIDGLKASIHKLYGVIDFGLILKSALIVIAAIPVLAATVMMFTIFTAIAGSYLAIRNLNKIQKETPDPSAVFKSVEQLADIIKVASEKMEGASVWALKKFDIGIGAITKAIALIVDTIIKIADEFSGPKGDERLLEARVGLQKILNDFFGVGPNPSEYSLMAVFNKLPSISKGQLRGAEALVPLTEAIDNITDTIKKVIGIKNVEEGIANLKHIVNFTASLQRFADGFSGGFFGAGSSESKIKLAVTSTEAMMPLIDNIEKIGRRVVNIQNVEEGSQNVVHITNFIKALQNFAEGFSGGFFGIGSSKDQIKLAITNTNEMIPLVDNIVTIGRKANMIQNIKQTLGEVIPLIRNLVLISEDASEFRRLRNSIYDNIIEPLEDLNPELKNLKKNILESVIEPLNKLDPGISKMNKLIDSTKNLNAELKKMTMENKEALETLANINEAGGVKNFMSSIFSLGGGTPQRFQTASQARDSAKTDQLLSFIAKDVHGIAQETIAGKATSWTDSPPPVSS